MQANDIDQFAARHLATEQRVVALEVNVEKLANKMDGGFEKLQSAIGLLSNNMSSAGRTDWKLVISICGFLMAFVAGIGTMAKTPMDAAIAGLTISMQEAKNDIRGDREAFMKKEDWRYERDRGYGQLKEVDAALAQRIDKLSDTVTANHESYLRSQGAKP